MMALAEQQNWPVHKWVYDGQKILYLSGDGFIPKHETVYEVDTAQLLLLHSYLPNLTLSKERSVSFVTSLKTDPDMHRHPSFY